MPLIKRNSRFFGRFLHAGSPKFKLSEISLKKDVKKMLPKVCRINHKKIPYLRASKLSNALLDDILDIFFNYFNVIKGVFCFFGRHPTQNVYLV